MIYRPGGETLVWGVLAEVKVVEEEEVPGYVEAGWFDHPSKLLEPTPEPEPEPEPEPQKRRGRPSVKGGE